MNERFKISVYDDRAIYGFCIIDLDKPCHTCRLEYEIVFIANEYSCELVVGLLNKMNNDYQELKNDYDTLKIQDDDRAKYLMDLMNENKKLKQELKESNTLIDEVWEKYEIAHGLSIENSEWFSD